MNSIARFSTAIQHNIIRKSFHHALQLVTVHLQHQNQALVLDINFFLVNKLAAVPMTTTMEVQYLLYTLTKVHTLRLCCTGSISI